MTNQTTTKSNIARSITAAAVAVGMLLSTGAAGADQIKAIETNGGTAKPFPADGVLFGEPPARNDGYLATASRSQVERSSILAEFEVGSGFVRFVDEGDSVATIIKGDRETFQAAADAKTVSELFSAVAPPRTKMPAPIVDAGDEPINALAGTRQTFGPTLENELIVGEDDWANGCDDDEFNSWESSFINWHGFILGNDTFSVSEHYVGGESVPDMHGYFGTMDEIWYGVCLVNGVVGSVDIERRVYDIGFPDGEGGFMYGSWQPIPGTGAELSPGERYLYHNHSHYGPLRRTELASIGTAKFTGWEYFISGAATDSFAPDDQFTN